MNATAWLGGLAAAALLAAAVLDRSDPLGAARDRVELEAAARADGIRGTWLAMRSSPDDLVPGAGRIPVVIPVEPPVLGSTDDAPRASEDVRALIAAARRARLGGEPARAARSLDLAEQRARDPRSAGLVLLERARITARNGETGELERARAGLSRRAEARVGRLSAALLAALIEPVDPALARRTLAEDPLALPAPRDVMVRRGDELVFQGDPLWGEIEARLTSAAPEGPWPKLFRRSERRAEALRALFGDRLSASADAWSLTRTRGVLCALRRVEGGVRVIQTSEEALAERIAALDPGAASVYSVAFDQQPRPTAEEVRGLEWLDGTSIGFTVHRADPLADGRRAARRLHVLRAGLVGLAIAILCATYFAVRATRRARRLERLRSTFVASVSHDLRTPIQSILLMAETLERGRVAGQGAQVQYFATIRQEAQRLRRFVEDVLDSARMDQGEAAHVHPAATDSTALFDALETSLAERARRDGARFAFVRGALPAFLEIDADAVLRIVWNLFENALRHGHEPGELADVTVTVAHAPESGQLVITVEDRGPGIDARYAASAFEPFERADAAERGTSGTGLGLAIVRELSRAHGGDARIAPSSAGARIEATVRAEPEESVA